MSFDKFHEKYANLNYLVDELSYWMNQHESLNCFNCRYFDLPKKFCQKWQGNPPNEEIIKGCESHEIDKDWFYRIEPKKRPLLPQVLADLASKPNQTELMRHLAEYQNRQGDL